MSTTLLSILQKLVSGPHCYSGICNINLILENSGQVGQLRVTNNCGPIFRYTVSYTFLVSSILFCLMSLTSDTWLYEEELGQRYSVSISSGTFLPSACRQWSTKVRLRYRLWKQEDEMRSIKVKIVKVCQYLILSSLSRPPLFQLYPTL